MALGRFLLFSILIHCFLFALAFVLARSQTQKPPVRARTWITLEPDIRKPKPHSPRVAEKTPNTDYKSRPLSHFGLQPLAPPASKNADEPNWAHPGTDPRDSVYGIRESDRSALNTREFKFYTYFQRVRERLDRAWVPLLRSKLIRYYQSGRHLASDMEHTTRILVTLNDRGEVTHVEILSESGNQILDEAAIGAFNQAGPFPNPPFGMIDSNHEVRIPWDFILKS